MHFGSVCGQRHAHQDGLGGLVSRYGLPDDLKSLYGGDLTSFMVFGRPKLI